MVVWWLTSVEQKKRKQNVDTHSSLGALERGEDDDALNFDDVIICAYWDPQNIQSTYIMSANAGHHQQQVSALFFVSLSLSLSLFAIEQSLFLSRVVAGGAFLCLRWRDGVVHTRTHALWKSLHHSWGGL